jgi:hypothetical protein
MSRRGLSDGKDGRVNADSLVARSCNSSRTCGETETVDGGAKFVIRDRHEQGGRAEWSSGRMSE